MKTSVWILTISLAVGMAVAQTQEGQKARKAGSTGSTAPAEMKTSRFQGTLVDMSCASEGSSSAACPISANSSKFGMKMDDGRTVKFDLVGNQRAQDAIKNGKGWNKQITAKKPIRAKVDGVLTGDKLIVSSIH